jgi:hypothetical protein
VRAFVSDDVWEALWAAQQAEQGCWPNAGGWLDQPRVLIDAVRMIGSDQARAQRDALERM